MDAVAERVQEGAKEFGLSLTDQTAGLFSRYDSILGAENRVMNLTAISEGEESARLHFLDSLAVFLAGCFAGKRVLDIGSGAGFPGVPIKLAEPNAALTLLDATGKRIAFLKRLCSALGLQGVEFIQGRAEEAGRQVEYRGYYDIAVSRAVARLNVLCELCLPFVAAGGCFMALKGARSEDEAAEAAGAMRALGGALEKSIDYKIPGTDITHRIVVIRKTGRTPEEYPRRYKRIVSSPL